jgi:hypothetical protein
MTTTRIYRSTDTGAPVLTGQVGSLLNLLDKCLVDGYTGKTAAGWSRQFTGTNKTAYRNSVAAGGTGMYLRVVDANAGYATVQVYASMSDIDTGADVAPATAQFASGVFWSKSVSSNTTARPWVVVADELTVWILIQNGSPGTYVYDSVFGAGDIASELASDPWRYFVLGRGDATNAGAGGVGYGGDLRLAAGTLTMAPATNEYLWLGRAVAGTGSSVPARCMMLSSTVNVGVGTQSASPLPNSSVGGGHEYWLPAIVAESATIRGRLRGLYVPVSRMGSVATFAARDDMPWAPAGSRVIVARHSSHAVFAEYGSDSLAAVGVETALEWT